MVYYFDEARVQQLLSVSDLLQGVREALMALTLGQVVQPLRMVMPIGEAANDGLLFLKPAQLGDALSTKLITLVPGNTQKGLPTLLSTIVLMDPSTGQTLAVMEGNTITAMRTAAASAVAADALVPRTPQVVAMLGSGPTVANAQQCAHDIGGVACASAEDAVRGADIVCTVTNASDPVLQGAWLKPGAFVAAVGAPRPTWRELDDAAMKNWVVADQREAAEKESGDVLLSGAQVAAEIGEILCGRVAPPPAGTTIIFKSLGQAVEDTVAARLVYRAALAEGACR
jgi:ornithine cyclodeaminase